MSFTHTCSRLSSTFVLHRSCHATDVHCGPPHCAAFPRRPARAFRPPSPAAGQGAQTDLTQLPLPLSIASQIPARARKPERLPGQQGQQEQAAAKSDHDAPYDWHDSPSCDDGDDDWRRDGASSRRVRRHDGSGCETLTSPRLLPGNGKPSNNASGPIGPTPGSGSPEGGTPGGGSTGGSSAGSGSPAGLPSGGPGNAPGSQGGSPGPTGRVFDFDPDGRWRPDLPAPGPWPALLGLGVGLTLLAAFGLPPVLQLARVPPLRVLRRDMGQPKAAPLAVLGLGVAGFAALLLAASRDATLGLMAVGGFAGAALLFALLARLAVVLLRRWAGAADGAPRWLALAARQITARPAHAVAQVSSLAVGLMALVLLVLLRTDLMASWQRATPPDAPNRFTINVMPDQAEDFRAALAQGGVRGYDWYPMFRGRLVSINGRPVTAASFSDERAQRLAEREFNLSHTPALPAHNSLAAGRWQPEEAGAASVEEGLAATLGIRLGDTLGFDFAGATHEVRVRSLRKVDWGSLRANFFVLLPVSELPDDVAYTWMAAWRSPGQPGFDNALVRQFPNITSIDMSATLAQVQRVLAQVIRAVEFLFAFTLAAGLLVLVAAITATREEKAREFAIMRALGASAALLGKVQRAELAGVGLLAGVLASLVASVLGWGLARHVFEFDWTAPLATPLLGSLAGAALALAAGWWSLREVLRRPVAQTLRQAGE